MYDSAYGFISKETENPVVHELILGKASERLNLDVSNNGIIGRGCSIVKGGKTILQVDPASLKFLRFFKH